MGLVIQPNHMRMLIAIAAPDNRNVEATNTCKPAAGREDYCKKRFSESSQEEHLRVHGSEQGTLNCCP